VPVRNPVRPRGATRIRSCCAVRRDAKFPLRAKTTRLIADHVTYARGVSATARSPMTQYRQPQRTPDREDDERHADGQALPEALIGRVARISSDGEDALWERHGHDRSTKRKTR
jgi:hypothetical protein